MGYMTSTTPLDSMSWRYGNNYLKNAGDFSGFTYTNNHTHLHKYRGKWYVLYHTEMLQDDMQMADGGFRSMMVEEIDVDEENVRISPADVTKQGVNQIQPLNPYVRQEAETAAATEGIKFEQGDDVGNMYACRGKAFAKHELPDESIILVRKVDFGRRSKTLSAMVKGEGWIEVRLDSIDSPTIATITSLGTDWKECKAKCKISGLHDLIFVVKGRVKFDYWKFGLRSR